MAPGNALAHVGAGAFTQQHVARPAMGEGRVEADHRIDEAGDIGATIHPHPTLSETVGMAAEMYEGTITDLYIPKRK